METILNEWDGSNAPVALYEPPEISEDVAAEFLESSNLEDIEAGIQKVERASDLLSLIRGLGIIKIEREGLWQQAGFKSLWEYQRVQAQRLGIPSPTITMSRRIAEAWIDNRKLLSSIPLEGNVSKLRYFNAAVKLHGNRRLVLKHYKEDSFRDFVRFSRPAPKPELSEVSASVRSGVLYINDLPIASLDPGIAEEERDFLSGILRRAYAARKGNLLPHIVAVYDQGEARAVDSFLKKYRESK